MHCSDTFFNDLSCYRPRIAISSCLLGEQVRYDGQTKANALLIDFFSSRAEIISVCPEVSAGLGIPRPAVQLIHTSNGIKAQGVQDHSLDVTQPLTDFSQEFCRTVLPKLHGVILKSRSPSCGLGTTPVYGGEEHSGTDNGIFANTLLTTSGCVISDELHLLTPALCERFLFLAYAVMDIGLTPAGQYDLLHEHYLTQHQLDITNPGWRHFYRP